MRRRGHRGTGAFALALGLLWAVAGPPAASAGDLSAADLTELEQLLAELNFDPGDIDGTVDWHTRTAIELYQEFAALPVDGEPSAKLLAELRSLAATFREIKAAQAAAPAGQHTQPQAAAPAPASEQVVPETPPAPSTPTEPLSGVEPQAARAVQPAPPPHSDAGAAPAPPAVETANAAAPTSEPVIEAAAESAPESASEPTPESASEPTVEPTLDSVVEPTREKTEAPVKTRAAEKTQPAFNLDSMISRLVRKTGPTDNGATAANTATDTRPSTAESTALDGYNAFKKGYAAVQAGEFDLAVAFYTHAIEAGDLPLDDLAKAFYNRANVRAYQKQFDFAIADYSAAIVNQPDFPSAYYNRGFALQARGDRGRAVEDFQKAREMGLQRLGVRSPDEPPPRP